MTTTTPNKTVGVTLFPWQDITTGNVVLGTSVDITGKLAIGLDIRVARKTGTAFTAGWPMVRIEVSSKAAGNDTWKPLIQIQPALGASIVNTTLNGAVLAAATSFIVVSATNIAVGDILFLEDGSQANYELVRVKSVSSNTITPEEPVTFAHQTGKIVTDQAEIAGPTLDVTPYTRIRAVIDNANSGQTIAAQVLMTSFDSLTTA